MAALLRRPQTGVFGQHYLAEPPGRKISDRVALRYEVFGQAGKLRLYGNFNSKLVRLENAAVRLIQSSMNTWPVTESYAAP